MSRRRRLSPQQKQENVSRKQFGDFLEPHEWITADVHPDLGEDFLVRIYENGVSTGLSFYVQLKSTADIQDYCLESGEIGYSFEVADLEHWATQVTTVVITIWDVSQKQGWWRWIDDIIGSLDEHKPNWRTQKSVRVHFPFEHVLNEGRLEQLRQVMAHHYYPAISQGKELKGKFKFRFPPTPEARAKAAELRKHMAFGDKIAIDGQFIKAVEFPELWVRLFGEPDIETMRLEMGPSKASESRPVQIDFHSPQYGNERMSPIELRVVKKGEEEMTLSNAHQGLPFKIQIIENRRTRQHRFTFTKSIKDMDGYVARQVLRIQQILSSGGNIRIAFLDAEKAPLEFSVAPGTLPQPDQKVLDLADKVCKIQNLSGQLVYLPEGGHFTEEDLEAADELISVLHFGQYRESGESFSIGLAKPAVEIIASKHKEGEPLYFRMSTEESFVDLLATRVQLGPMTQKIKGFWEMPMSRVKTWIEESTDDDVLEIRLADVEIHSEFADWL